MNRLSQIPVLVRGTASPSRSLVSGRGSRLSPQINLPKHLGFQKITQSSKNGSEKSQRPFSPRVRSRIRDFHASKSVVMHHRVDRVSLTKPPVVPCLYREPELFSHSTFAPLCLSSSVVRRRPFASKSSRIPFCPVALSPRRLHSCSFVSIRGFSSPFVLYCQQRADPVSSPHAIPQTFPRHRTRSTHL